MSRSRLDEEDADPPALDYAAKETPTVATSVQVHPFDALATIGCIYLGLITFGFAAFRYLAVLPMGASRNQDRTFFTSVNAVSLTGFTQGNAAVENYPTLGLVLLATLALVSTLTTLIGGAYLFARVLGWPLRMRTIVATSLVIVLVPITVSAFFIGLFDSISASTGLGLSASHDHALWYAPLAIGVATLGLLGVLPVLALIRPTNVVDARKYLAPTILAIAGLTIFGAVVLAMCGTSAIYAATESLGLRAFGNASQRLDSTAAMPWAVALLACLGAAPASIAGGLGVLPIVITCRAAVDALRSRVVDPIAGVAIVWIAVFFVAVAASILFLAACAPAVPGERVFVLALGALANVGISHEPVGLTGDSLFILSAAMLVGRLLPLVMLAWMACVREKATYASPVAV